ncbi:MAG: DNA translocase FtsK 4TM domain-containing protein [Candidatus Saccharimonadales bacterium]
MAKRKKSRKKSTPSSPSHKLPAGFWQQVTALVLIAVSIILVVAWFGVGGPVLDWIQSTAMGIMGYAIYSVPLLFTYVAVEIFRANENKLPFVMKGATALLLVWLAGLFGLMPGSHGGWIGENINPLMLNLVESPIAAFIYILLIIITALFVVRVSPIVIIKKIWAVLQTEKFDTNNVTVIRQATAEIDEKKKPVTEFKLNAGVEMLDPSLIDDKKSSRLSTLRGSVKQDKAAEEQAALVSVNDPNWEAPGVDLLEKKQSPADAGDVQQNAQIIKDTLSEFSIDVEMEGANIGPKVTQYTLSPPSGVKLTRITALETNIALNLAAQAIRIEAPIPGKRAVGIEVPNRRAADVRIRGILESKEWSNDHEPLAFAVGRDISGSPVVGELNKMPHLLVAGQTNSGKSVMINTLLCSLLYRNSPSQMKLILVDPKQVEMARYQDIPHLLTPIITEPEKTVSALKWAVNEMERRYKLLAEVGELNIQDYNNSLRSARKKITVQDEKGHEQQAEDGAMPYIVIIIDEMADLMMVASRDVEALVVRLAQKARAIGIHLVLATQSPRADVITGLIKANVPAKIAFTVGNQVESRIILDQVGAEKLLGQGDMLYKTATMNKPIRVQGAWVMNNEVKKIADHLRMQSPPQYNNEIISQPVQLNGKGGVVMDFATDISGDHTYQEALRFVIESGKASASVLQRRLGIGYARASRYIDTMEDQGIVGPPTGNSKPRDVLVRSMDELNGGSEEEV